MDTSSLKAACLAVGLATAWGTQANADLDQIQLTITPSNNLTHAYFLYGANASGSPSQLVRSTLRSLPDLVAGKPTTETFFIDPFSKQQDGPHVYSVIGLYDEPNKLLTLGFNNSEAGNVIGNKDFDTEFAPYTEDAIATALLSNDTTTVLDFFKFRYFSQIPINESGQLVNFSNGSDGGWLSAAIVPEPSPILLVSFGALAILAFHGKQRRLLLFMLKRIRDQ